MLHGKRIKVFGGSDWMVLSCTRPERERKKNQTVQEENESPKSIKIYMVLYRKERESENKEEKHVAALIHCHLGNKNET